MTFAFSGGKRQREAERDRKKRDKAERLRKNREQRSRENGAEIVTTREALPEVRLEDIVIGVPSRPRAQAVGPTRLFVGGLSWGTNSDRLREAFSRFGTIAEATVIPDRDTGRSRGFGFVTFENPKDAEAASAAMNGADLDGRTLKVNHADPR
jgi:RNA recognition motif-containing protein